MVLFCLTCLQVSANLCIHPSRTLPQFKGPLNFERILDKNLFDRALSGETVDPRELLINLENYYNYFIASPIQYNLNFVPLKANRAEVYQLEGHFPYEGQEVSYYLHPTNRFEEVPFSQKPKKWQTGLPAYSSASRSLYLATPDGAFHSIRMATDFPTGLQWGRNEEKARGLSEEIPLAIRRARYVQAALKKVRLKNLEIALDVAAMAPKSERPFDYGNLIRDLSFVARGDRYYVPVLSLPKIYSRIAKKDKKDPILFWQEHYVVALARAQAEAFLKLGLLHSHPHGQNVLMEFDRDFKPTGRFVFRDLDNTRIHQSLRESVDRQFSFDGAELDPSPDKLYIHTAYILKVFTERVLESPIPKRVFKDWSVLHEKVFIATVTNAIGRPDLAEFSLKDLQDQLNGSAQADLIKYYQSQFDP